MKVDTAARNVMVKDKPVELTAREYSLVEFLALHRGEVVTRTQLYEHLFTQATAAGHTRVVCEVNEEPPNPASDAFHRALGFEVVGSAAIHGGTKQVRYFARDLLS